MRAEKRDISEIFGFAADDRSEQAMAFWKNKTCPFKATKCTKFNSDQSIIYGVCSVSNGVSKGVGTEVIICPKRLYANSYQTLNDAANAAWPDIQYELLVGNISAQDIKTAVANTGNAIVAFGQGSGNEITVNSPNGKLSMDWVLQRYGPDRTGKIVHHEFIGIEVQSIDITGNYRENWEGYANLKSGKSVSSIPNSGHGLNWANVHKRLIPQIIRKGNVYSECPNCIGFFFILPDIVFKKFEEILGFNNSNSNITLQPAPSNEILSALTYKLGAEVSLGEHRDLELVRRANFLLQDIIIAFSENQYGESADELERTLSNIIVV